MKTDFLMWEKESVVLKTDIRVWKKKKLYVGLEKILQRIK